VWVGGVVCCLSLLSLFSILGSSPVKDTDGFVPTIAFDARRAYVLRVNALEEESSGEEEKTGTSVS